MPMRDDIRRLVEATPFVDTHEHLLEESTRLRPPPNGDHGFQTQTDFSVLFSHYADNDLRSAGMTEPEVERLSDRRIAPRDKWKLIEPYYDRCRQTGYLLNVRRSLRMLFGDEDIDASNCEAISQRIAAQIRPGFYRHILRDVAKVEHCQVNSLETPVFMETADPELLCQDLSFRSLASDVKTVTAALPHLKAGTLADWHGAIDWCFATYGPRAIAVKNQIAYYRDLDFADVPADAAAPHFAAFARDPASLPPAARKAVEDHLVHFCIRRAAEYRLPVKLHTGFFAGNGYMPLHRVGRNAGDMCELLMRHPQTPFVIMHITWPYPDQAIALAKHFRNAYVDLCWAWIINPAAGVRFVKEFLMAAPANKLLTFGGDYMPIEMVPGHAAVARQGLGQAIAELIEEGWLAESDAPTLIDRLMRGNAHELFDYRNRLNAWTPASSAALGSRVGR